MILVSAPDLAVVGFATNGEGAVSRAAEPRPDEVQTDSKMSKLNGIHVTRRIMQQTPDVEMLVLAFNRLDDARPTSIYLAGRLF